MQIETQEYLDQIKSVQKSLLAFIDNDDDIEEGDQILNQTITNLNIKTDKYRLRAFLYLILHISNNHNRSSFFFNKFEKILKSLKTDIDKRLGEFEIFEIFQKNKRLLLFLIQEKMITVNPHFAAKLMKNGKNNCLYFYNEIKDFIKIDNFENDPNLQSKDYLSKREAGLNDQIICQIIRNDSLDEFVSYINRMNYSLNATIEQSIYETNPFLVDKKPTFIEYSAFYGSIQIMKYLFMNNVKTTPDLWLYAIHSNNLQVIHLLEENKINTDSKLEEKLLKNSIKCHHNDITNYLLTLFFNSDDYFQFNTIQQNFVDYSFHYYNYAYFPKKFNKNSIMNGIIKYDHFDIFQIIYQNKSVNAREAFNYAIKEGKKEIISFLSLYSTDINDRKPFSVWEITQDGHIKVTDDAKDRICSSYFPCFVICYGILRTGKSTLSSHLFNGPNVDILNSPFKISGSFESCTHKINAIGPIKCKELALSFDISPDDLNNENLNRDIFIIDTEGLNSYYGEVKWITQALYSMIPLINVSLFVTNSINKDLFDQFTNFSSLIQNFERIKIGHGCGYIYNKEQIDDDNVIQHLLKQNENITNNIILKELSSKFDDINKSHYKCFSVLTFDRHFKEYFSSLREVACFIVDICLYEGSKINGNLIVNIFERFANEINDISNNLNSPETLEKMKNIFLQSINDELMTSIKNETKNIQKQVSKMLIFNSSNLDLFTADDFMLNIEKNNFIEKLLNEVIQKICSNEFEFDPSIIDSARSLARNITKKAFANELQGKIDHDIYIKEIIKQILNRLDQLENSRSKKKNRTCIRYDGNVENQFNGILTHLGNGNSLKSLENGIIEILSSSIIDENADFCQPKNILNYEDENNYFQSKNEQNAWICIHFINSCVNITNYSIKSYGNSGKCDINLKNWDILGSNDFKNWDVLDNRHDEKSFENCGESNTFEVSNSLNQHNYYKYIKLLEKDENENSLILSSLELFGTIKYL